MKLLYLFTGNWKSWKLIIVSSTWISGLLYRFSIMQLLDNSHEDKSGTLLHNPPHNPIQQNNLEQPITEKFKNLVCRLSWVEVRYECCRAVLRSETGSPIWTITWSITWSNTPTITQTVIISPPTCKAHPPHPHPKKRWPFWLQYPPRPRWPFPLHDNTSIHFKCTYTKVFIYTHKQ